ncbi:MAG: hypothetical protein AAF682_27355 [Planctomycetota bacterium]
MKTRTNGLWAALCAALAFGTGIARADGGHDVTIGGDLNGDCIVDELDELIVLMAWGTDDCVADINGDGIVDQADYDIVLENLGNECEPDDPPSCEPYWTTTEVFDIPCQEIKPVQTCPLGQMSASSSASGPAAGAGIEGYEGGPFCAVQNQSACAASTSWNFTFEDPCGGYCPKAYVNAASIGTATADAEHVVCINAHSWVVVVGIAEVECTLWDLGEMCVCTVNAAKDSDSEWQYITTIKVKGVSVPISIPVKTSSGPITDACTDQGAGGDKVGMFTIVSKTTIHVAGHADGCVADTSQVIGSGMLTNVWADQLGYTECPGGGGDDPKIGFD